MNKPSRIFIILSLICLLLVIISPLASLMSSLLALGIFAYFYSQSRKPRKVRERGSQLKILIVLPRESKKLRQSFNFRVFDEKSKIKVLGNSLVKLINLSIITSITISSIVMCILANTVIPLLSLPPLLAITSCFPLLRQKLSESIRKHNVENELPFFSLLASALSHAGQTLAKAFNVVAETNVFPALRLEALYLKKEELFVGKDPITAMNSYAQRHPSKLLSSLILGYTSIVKSGGDVTRYLEEKTKELFLMLKDRWNGFVNNVGVVGEAMLALFLVTPLMLSMTTLVFASEVNIAFYELMIFGIIPLLSLTTLYFIHIARPYESIEYAPTRKTIIPSLTSLIISATLTSMLNQPLFNVAIISSMATALPLLLGYEREKVRTLKIEGELPRFLRYLGEHKKLGFPILTAIERSSNEHYNEIFHSLIKSALSRMRLGLSLYQSIIALKVRSKLCKIVFFTLDNLIETGGGSPATFEVMASYLEDYNMQRSKVRRSLYLYSILGYLSPLILAVCLSLTSSFTIGIDEPISLDLVEDLSLSVLSPQEEVGLMLFYGKLMIVLSSIAIGVTLGKAIDGTLFSTKHLLICTSVALITLNLLL